MKHIQFTTTPDSTVDSAWRLGAPVLGVRLIGVVHLDDESLSSESVDGHRFCAKLSPDVGEKVQALLCESVMASLQLIEDEALTDASGEAIAEIRSKMNPSLDVAFIFPRNPNVLLGGAAFGEGALLCVTAHDGVVTLTVGRAAGSGDWILSWALSRQNSRRVVDSLIAGFSEAIDCLRRVDAGFRDNGGDVT